MKDSHDWEIKLDLLYESNRYKELPHVIKFSGGRSSGMMLLLLLEKRVLDPARGDVVVFNNTSAEHPATYDFVRACSNYTESRFGVPFYWIEYATFEDAYNGNWTRRPSFRLVNQKPLTKANPNGYRWQGEVFEELVSVQGFLPSRHTRTCTKHLKVQSTSDFLTEWFEGNLETERRGHYHQTSQISDEDLIDRHRKSGGKMTDEELLFKKSYARACPPAIEVQRFSEFSCVGSHHMMDNQAVRNDSSEEGSINDQDKLEYLSFIGLRADEPLRVARVQTRSDFQNKKDDSSQISNDTEIVRTPLADAGVTNADVNSFWGSRDWGLQLPTDAGLSNCVYCFMKGTRNIRKIKRDIEQVDAILPKEIRSVPNTPSDILWWVDLEEKYQRKPVKRYKGRGRPSQKKVTVGFWGVDADITYRDLSECDDDEIEAHLGFSGESSLPCDCTD